MRKIHNCLIGIIFLIFLSAQIGLAEVPQTINYQGRLTDASGDPVPDGDYDFSFAIYSDESGGSPIWGPEVPKPITVTDGLFTWDLGSVEDFSDGFFYDNATLYLGITVDPDPEIEPRTRLRSVPFALHALKSDSAIYASEVLPNSINSSHIENYSITNIDIQDQTITGTKIENGSITEVDIADEPGIVRSENLTALISTSGNTNITSATIDAPGYGYVVARAIAWCELGGAQIGTVRFYIATSASGNEISGEWTLFGSNNVANSGEYRYGSLTTERVFSVSPGSVTYYLNANRGTYAGGSAYVVNAKLLLTYFPTNYGTVTTKSESSENNNDVKGE